MNMKRRFAYKRGFSLALAAALVGLTACGVGENAGVASVSGEGAGTELSGDSAQGSSSQAQGALGQSTDNAGTSGGLDGMGTGTNAPSADGSAGNIFENLSGGLDEESATEELTNITVALPSSSLHTESNVWYDRLVEKINEHTGLNITWKWYTPQNYYEQLEKDICSGEVADIILTDRSEVFLNAAEEGLFWEIGAYLDDYDNLAMIPEICRVGGSYNGKVYAIAQKSGPVTNGMCYRLDWLEALELEKPTDWESFCKMLYAFTYADPDGNGVNDTVGLVLDSGAAAWDVMECWFGVPNSWGIDENGDLIHKTQTEQYKNAYTAFRELYAQGVINNGTNGVTDFRELPESSAHHKEFKYSRGGCTIGGLYECYSIWDDLIDEGIITEEDDIYALQVCVDTGYGELCYPSGGDAVKKMLAISTRRVKSEAQLQQVLQFINDICDGEITDLIYNGWEGETYALDENGYLVGLLPEKNVGGLVTYNRGFTEIVLGHVAEENEKIRLASFEGSKLMQSRSFLMEEHAEDCVINYGYQFLNEDEISEVQSLEAMLYEAEIQYITGEIDEAGFKAALAEWMESGGEAMTREINEKYHAAGY